MESLNTAIRRVIPELTYLARGVDAPDGFVHVAADVFVNPVWDESAMSLSADPAKMRVMRQRLWRVLGERIAADDPVARVSVERWLLQSFVSGDPSVMPLLAEMPDDLRAVKREGIHLSRRPDDRWRRYRVGRCTHCRALFRTGDDR